MSVVEQWQIGREGVIRNRAISSDLEVVLLSAAEAADIDAVVVTSGGQPGTHGKRIGSSRHDHGRAADLHLVKDGTTLRFTDRDGNPDIETFVTAAAANGANGIGAGEHYMGASKLHIGFGTNPGDDRQIVWGAGGRSVNAPDWLRRAAQQGWDNQVAEVAVGPSMDDITRLFSIIARGGLHLRKGPGLDYGITSTIPGGTAVTVAGFDGLDGEWARVDLKGDGMVDGHLLAAFLEPVDFDDVEEIEETGPVAV